MRCFSSLRRPLRFCAEESSNVIHIKSNKISYNEPQSRSFTSHTKENHTLKANLSKENLDKTKSTKPHKREIATALIQQKIIEANPSINSIVLHFNEENKKKFTFSSGQWADFWYFKDGDIKNTSKENAIIGGFSITSTPKELREHNTVRFSIKKTRHPVTIHIHDDVKVGDSLHLVGGQGEFYYTKERFPGKSEVVLIGGGIGVTPLLSILRHINDSEPDISATFIHSIRNNNEALCKDEIKEMTKSRDNIKAIWKITGHDHHPHLPSEQVETYSKRIDTAFLRSLNLNLSRSVFFVCGPVLMVKSIVSHLHEMGVHDDQIQYEKWT